MKREDFSEISDDITSCNIRYEIFVLGLFLLWKKEWNLNHVYRENWWTRWICGQKIKRISKKKYGGQQLKPHAVGDTQLSLIYTRVT